MDRHDSEFTRDMEKNKGTKGTKGTARDGAGCSGSLGKIPKGTKGTGGALMGLDAAAIDPLNDPTGTRTKPFPGEAERPCYRNYDDWCGADGKQKPGVYHHYMSRGTKSDPPSPVDLFVCSPLHIKAVTSTDDERFFGRLLNFRNTHGHWRYWGMPMEMLRGSCEELRGELLASGVLIDY